MTASTHDPANASDLTESEDFQSMRRQDAIWTGPKLTVILVVTLAIAIAFIYFIASVVGAGY